MYLLVHCADTGQRQALDTLNNAQHEQSVLQNQCIRQLNIT